MNRTDDAINFLFDLDFNLDKQLKATGRSYDKFLKDFDKLNEKTKKQVGKGMEQLNEMFDLFRDLPKQAERSYAAAVKGLQKKIEPLTQKVKITFSPGDMKGITKAVGKAVSDAFSKASFRMSPTLPKKRSNYFEHGNVRSLYKHIPQPPDLLGKITGQKKIPKFKTGGVVPSMPGASKSQPDSVLAWLTPGELVMPPDILKEAGMVQDKRGHLHSHAEHGKFSQQISPDVLESMSRAATLFAGIEKIRKTSNAGLGGPGLIKEMRKAMKSLTAEMRNLEKVTRNSNVHAMFPLVDKLGQMRKDYADLIPEMQHFGREENTVRFKTLDFLETFAKFKLIKEFLGDAKAFFNELLSGATEVGAHIGADLDQVKEAKERLNEMNTTLGLTRPELFKLNAALADSQQKLGLAEAGFQGTSEAALELVNAGVRDTKMLEDLAPRVNALSQVTGIDKESLSKQFAYLTMNVGENADQVMALDLSYSNLGARFKNVSSNELEDTAAKLNNITASFKNMGDQFGDKEVTLRMQKQLGLFRAALQTTFAGGVDITEELDKALGGDIDAMKDLTMQTGKTASQIVTQFSGPNGAIDVIDDIRHQYSGMIREFNNTQSLLPFERDQKQLFIFQRAVASGFMGTRQEFENFIQSEDKYSSIIQDGNMALVDTSDALNKTAEGLKTVISPWDRWRNSVSVSFNKKFSNEIMQWFDNFDWRIGADIYLLAKFGKAIIGGAYTGVMKLGEGIGSVGKSLYEFFGKGAVSEATEGMSTTGKVTAESLDAMGKAEAAVATESVATTSTLSAMTATLGSAVATGTLIAGATIGIAILGDWAAALVKSKTSGEDFQTSLDRMNTSIENFLHLQEGGLAREFFGELFGGKSALKSEFDTKIKDLDSAADSIQQIGIELKGGKAGIRKQFADLQQIIGADQQALSQLQDIKDLQDKTGQGFDKISRVNLIKAQQGTQADLDQRTKAIGELQKQIDVLNGTTKSATGSMSASSVMAAPTGQGYTPDLAGPTTAPPPSPSLQSDSMTPPSTMMPSAPITAGSSGASGTGAGESAKLFRWNKALYGEGPKGSLIPLDAKGNPLPYGSVDADLVDTARKRHLITPAKPTDEQQANFQSSMQSVTPTAVSSTTAPTADQLNHAMAATGPVESSDVGIYTRLDKLIAIVAARQGGGVTAVGLSGNNSATPPDRRFTSLASGGGLS